MDNEIHSNIKEHHLSKNHNKPDVDFPFLVIFPPSYSVWENLVIVQVSVFWFLTDLHDLGSGDSKKQKISIVCGVLVSWFV